MKRTLKYILLAIVVVVWYGVFYRIDPTTPIQAFFAALFLSAVSVMIYLAIAEIVRRYKSGEQIWTWQEEKPRKLPLWYRILSKIFC